MDSGRRNNRFIDRRNGRLDLANCIQVGPSLAGIDDLFGFACSPAAYYGIRLPIKSRLDALLQMPTSPGAVPAVWQDVVQLLYAPLTEEPVKLVPWLILLGCGVNLWPTRRRIVPLAMSLGLGFAVGEIWLIAFFIASSPKFADVPWYQFGGYIGERLMTVFSHSLFALPTIWFSRRGLVWAVVGAVIGMALHFAGNAPIGMMHRNCFGWSTAVWSILCQIWLIVYVFVSLLLFAYLHFGLRVLKQILRAEMVCPECGATYRQPLVKALNFGAWRYEPCEACGKWHWVSIANLAPLTHRPKIPQVPVGVQEPPDRASDQEA